MVIDEDVTDLVGDVLSSGGYIACGDSIMDKANLSWTQTCEMTEKMVGAPVLHFTGDVEVAAIVLLLKVGKEDASPDIRSILCKDLFGGCRLLPVCEEIKPHWTEFFYEEAVEDAAVLAAGSEE